MGVCGNQLLAAAMKGTRTEVVLSLESVSSGLVDVYFFSPKIPSYYGSFLCTEIPNIMGLFYVHHIPNIMGLFYVHHIPR